MLNNEILQQKTFAFQLRSLLEISSGTLKRVWNIKYCQNMYFIDKIAIDKKKSYPSLSHWNYVQVFVSETSFDLKKKQKTN